MLRLELGKKDRRTESIPLKNLEIFPLSSIDSRYFRSPGSSRPQSNVKVTQVPELESGVINLAR